MEELSVGVPIHQPVNHGLKSPEIILLPKNIAKVLIKGLPQILKERAGGVMGEKPGYQPIKLRGVFCEVYF